MGKYGTQVGGMELVAGNRCGFILSVSCLAPCLHLERDTTRSCPTAPKALGNLEYVSCEALKDSCLPRWLLTVQLVV